MGVELKLIIGEIWKQDEEATAEWLEFLKDHGQSIHEITRVDLSKVDESVWKLVYKAQAEAAERIATTGIRYAIYTDGVIESEGSVTEQYLKQDRYGSPISAIRLDELLPVLKEEFEESKKDYAGQGYRRYELAIAIIEVMLARFAYEEKHRLVALTWGH